MKTKTIIACLGVWLALVTTSPACLYCMKLEQMGISPRDPSGLDYSGQSVQRSPMTSTSSQTNAAAIVTTNIPVELPKSNAPAAATFTNGALVGFDVLAGYDLPLVLELEYNTTNGAWADAQVNKLIPANIHALDHRVVSVEGFMIPAHLDNGKVVEFLLSRNPPACCFGGSSQIHEWVSVRVKPPGVEAELYNVVRTHGILSVGAERVGGSLTSIYRMDADKVESLPEH